VKLYGEGLYPDFANSPLGLLILRTFVSPCFLQVADLVRADFCVTAKGACSADLGH
jgi:hypothetical protein